MPGEIEFDMAAAVDEIGAGLGFESEGDGSGTDNDVDLQVDLPGSSNRDSVAAPGGTPDSVGGKEGEVAGDGSALNPAATGDPATSADGTPADPLAEPPKTWRKEAAELWSTLPPAARQEVLKREADIFKGIEGYKEAAAFGKTFRDVLTPFMPVMERYNINPAEQVAGLMKAHHTLALGTPAEKTALFQQLLNTYQVQLPSTTPAEDGAYVDPAVLDLQSQVQSLQSRLSAEDQHRQAQAVTEKTREIEAFAADPANTHFDAVAHDMVRLIEGGVSKDLKEAYEKAVWANPVTRAAEIKRQQAEDTRKAQEAETARVAEARKATAANVRTTAKSGSATAPLGSIDDTLSESLAAIRGRS